MSPVEAALHRMRAAAAHVAVVESPYPLIPPHFAPGCSSTEVNALLGSAALRVQPYVEFLGLCSAVDAADVFNGYFLFSPWSVVRQTHGPKRLLIGEGLSLVEVDVLAIGGDGGGNLFLMAISANLPGRVWKWNHEHAVREDGTAIRGFIEIAPDFERFLDRIALDWEHFIANDIEWKYLSG